MITIKRDAQRSGRYTIDGRSYGIGDLIEMRADLISEMRGILDAAETESRDLSAEERQEYDRRETDVKRFDASISAHEADRGAPAIVTGGGDRVAHDATVLTPEQRMADWQARRPSTVRLESDLDPEELRSFNLGRLIRGMVTGRWDGAGVEQRVLAEGTDSAGGFLTPEILGANVIDLVRNEAQVFRAGARTVPVESDLHSIARLASGVHGAWRNENAAVSIEDPTFERVTFRVKSLAVLVKCSMELLEDAVDRGASIQNDISRALALELDRVALRGSGTPPEPQGVRNQTDVTIQSLGANGATPTNYSPLLDAVSALQQLNHQPNAILDAARTEKTFAGLADTTGQPLRPPALVADVPRLVTNQIPVNITQGTSNDTSEIYTGDWTQLLVGVRPSVGVRVRVLNERFADNLQVGILAYLRADVQLAHPEAFVVTTGVRP